jgi:hypothetical protein
MIVTKAQRHAFMCMLKGTALVKINVSFHHAPHERPWNSSPKFDFFIVVVIWLPTDTLEVDKKLEQRIVVLEVIKREPYVIVERCSCALQVNEGVVRGLLETRTHESISKYAGLDEVLCNAPLYIWIGSVVFGPMVLCKIIVGFSSCRSIVVGLVIIVYYFGASNAEEFFIVIGQPLGVEPMNEDVDNFGLNVFKRNAFI